MKISRFKNNNEIDLILSVFCNIGGTVDLDKSKALQVSNRLFYYV